MKKFNIKQIPLRALRFRVGVLGIESAILGSPLLKGEEAVVDVVVVEFGVALGILGVRGDGGGVAGDIGVDMEVDVVVVVVLRVGVGGNEALIGVTGVAAGVVEGGLEGELLYR